MKKLVLFFVSCFILTAVHAQVPTWTWAASAGSTLSEEGTAISTDAAGNILVTGNFRSPSINFGSTTLTNAGGQFCGPGGCWDIFVAKYSPSGVPLWAKRIGGQSEESNSAIATDAAGNVYVAGFYYSPSMVIGSTVLNNAGNFDIFIVKYDAQGNLLWARSEGGSGIEEAMAIAADTSGLYITGMYSAPVTFGNTTLTPVGDMDVFVMKCNTQGNIVWAKSFGGVSGEMANGIALDKNSNVFVLGNFLSDTLKADTFRVANQGTLTFDIFLLKLDKQGSPLWLQSVGSYDDEIGYGVCTDTTGNAFVTGSFESYYMPIDTTIFYNTVTGMSDILTVKFDSLGQIKWATHIGGDDRDISYGIATDKNGTVFIGGNYWSDSMSIGNTVLHNQGSLIYDFFLAAYSNSGLPLWAKNVGGAGDERIGSAGIAVDPGGYVVATGQFNSPFLSFDASTINQSGGGFSTPDIFVAKLGPTCTNAASIPSGISGNQTVCSGNTETYSVPPVYGASSYIWTLPNSWTGTSSTNTINAVAGSSGGNITVSAVNMCGQGLAQSVSVIVNPSPTPSIALTGSTVSTQSGFYSYQWYRNGSLINGATNQSYTATQSGNYHVVVVDTNNCSGSSAPAYVIGTGINDLRDGGFALFPTVNNGTFSIDMNDLLSTWSLNVTDLYGRRLNTETNQINDHKLKISVSGASKGIYFVRLQNGHQTYTAQIVIK